MRHCEVTFEVFTEQPLRVIEITAADEHERDEQRSGRSEADGR